MDGNLASYGYLCKPHMASMFWEPSLMGLTTDSKAILAANLTELLSTRQEAPRLELAKRMGVADGTLGRIKYGTGNPTVEVLDQIASFFKIPTWSLLKPKDGELHTAIDALATLATPRSRAALQSIQAAAEQGDLTETDLLLLQRIADRFMQK